MENGTQKEKKVLDLLTPIWQSGARKLILCIASTLFVASQPFVSIAQTTSYSTVYADEWCSTPGTLDDTCFTNAIAAIQANSVTGSIGASRHMGIILVRPGVYTFNHTVTIPAPTSASGVNISIKGEYQTSVWGAVLQNGATPVDFFHVQADSVDIKNLAFVVQPQAPNIAAIVLGSTTAKTYDTHINWCWFAGMGQAIHIVNAGGLDLSHNTFDSGTIYGIYSNAQGGDITANNIMATDLVGFGQISTILMIGDGTSNFGQSTFSGTFDRSIADSAVKLQNVIGVNVSGVFAYNTVYDMAVVSSIGVNIGPWQSYSSGQTSVHVANSTNVKIFSGTIVNTGAVLSGQNTVEVADSVNTTIHDVSSSGTSGAGYGLSVNQGSTGTIVYGNSFSAQTATAINVFDTTATFPVSGVLTADHLGSTRVATITALNSSGATCAAGVTCTDTSGLVYVPNSITSGGDVALITFGLQYSAGVCVVGNANRTYAPGGWSISPGTSSVVVSATSASIAGTYFSYICMGP